MVSGFRSLVVASVYFVSGVFAVFSTSAVASNQESAHRLQTLLKDFSSMAGQFTQQVSAADGEVLQESAGEFWLRRPGMIRWQTEEPFPQLLVSDGKQLWLYDEDLEQVTVKTVSKAVAGTPAFILSGNFEQLTRDYDISDLSAANGQAFTLSPRFNDSNYQYITLEFNEGKLSSLAIIDTLGQKTRIDFPGLQLNTDLANVAFSFTPPAGTDILSDD